jgi:hypothetical protein
VSAAPMTADEDPDEHVEVAPPQDIGRPQHAQAALRRRGLRPLPEQGVVRVAARLQIRLLVRVCAGRSRCGRWREQLEHAQRRGAERERVMPRVAAEEHTLAGGHPLDLAGLRVGDHQRALQHVQHLVSGEHRAVGLGVTERAARPRPVRHSYGTGTSLCGSRTYGGLFSKQHDRCDRTCSLAN